MLKSFWGIALLIVIALFMFWAVYTNAGQLLAFAAALLIAGISVLLLWLVDTFVLHSFDTLQELKNGNIAVGLSLLAYAVVIGSAIIAAFAVFA
jgi:hypothetical protein